MMSPEKTPGILAKEEKAGELCTYEAISGMTEGKKTIFMMAVFHPR